MYKVSLFKIRQKKEQYFYVNQRTVSLAKKLSAFEEISLIILLSNLKYTKLL